jgi:predicted phosphodiesterase
MTRLAILADLHGNLPALEAVLQDLSQFRVDRVIVAGDLVNWGPFSAQVLERVTREGCAVVRGNAEFYLLDYNTRRAPAEWNDHSFYPLLPWLRQQLNGRWHNVIAAWPDTLCLRFPDAPPIRVFHGSPRSPQEPIYRISTTEEVEAILAGVEETTVVAGHTHLALERQVGRWHILNPGSVGGPADGDPAASYMLLEGNEAGWRPTFRRIPFGYEPLWQEYERQKFLDERGVIGRFVVQEFKTARLHLISFLNWRQACHPDAPLTMELVDEFAGVNRWDYTPLAYHVNLPAEETGC